jgi:hypothetical protein
VFDETNCSQVEQVHLDELDDEECWGPSAFEGPQKHDLTMFSK